MTDNAVHIAELQRALKRAPAYDLARAIQAAMHALATQAASESPQPGPACAARSSHGIACADVEGHGGHHYYIMRSVFTDAFGASGASQAQAREPAVVHAPEPATGIGPHEAAPQCARCHGDGYATCQCVEPAPYEPPSPDTVARRRDELERGIAYAINCVSGENDSNTPDFILAEFLAGCLDAWNAGFARRARWYGSPNTASQPNGPPPVTPADPEQQHIRALARAAAENARLQGVIADRDAMLASACEERDAALARLAVGPAWLPDIAVALGEVREGDGKPLALNWTQALAAIRELRKEKARALESLARVDSDVETLESENECLRERTRELCAAVDAFDAALCDIGGGAISNDASNALDEMLEARNACARADSGPVQCGRCDGIADGHKGAMLLPEHGPRCPKRADSGPAAAVASDENACKHCAYTLAQHQGALHHCPPLSARSRYEPAQEPAADRKPGTPVASGEPVTREPGEVKS